MGDQEIPMQTVRIVHSPEGVGWTEIHPDGTTTEVIRMHETFPESPDLDDDDEDEGTVLGAYLETGEVLYGEAAREAYRRRHDG